ncbi:MAG: hypothetical protein C0621_02530 [Desulfuromonas sp.]|nr:MAG: hypothetical protein C0621_02530 [Desulfuromonas sp.]
MELQIRKTGLLAAIVLLVSVIWHMPVQAATVPDLASLGRISSDRLAFVSALDVDSEGNLYVADSLNHVVYRFDMYGELAETYSSAFLSAGAMAVDSGRSRLYVGDRTIVRVLDLDSGSLVGSLGSGEGEFGNVDMIKVDADGYVYVVDQSVLKVRVYGPDGSECAYSIGAKGTTLSTLISVWALAIDDVNKEVYVADVQTYGRTPAKVVVYDMVGNYKRSLSMTTSFGTPSLAWFGGIAFGGKAGNERAYFLDTMLGQVRVMSAPAVSGGLLLTYGTQGIEVGQLAMPRAVAYDGLTHRLFVSSDGGRVEVFGVDGAINPTPPVTNVKPGIPVPYSPTDNVEVSTATPLLQIENAVDADGDVLTYQVQVYADDTLVVEYLEQPEGEGNTDVQVDVSLPENAQITWRVQAADAEEVSGWSGLESFYVNATPEAPSAPSLLRPVAAAVVDGADLISWDASVDPDPYDAVQYMVEVSSDPSFEQVVAESELSELRETALADLTGYAALMDGEAYFLRVLAVDEHGTTSYSDAQMFVYDTTLVSVDANMPGVKVYFGGNYGYYGSYAGVTPLEIQDFTPGQTSLVLVKSGFEPVVKQITVGENENLSVSVALRPAISPEDLKARPLEVDATKISLSGDAVPYLVDLNGDGLLDLVTGELSGRISVAAGAESLEGDLYFGALTEISGLPLLPGATPVVVDWNNDRLNDFVIGAEDGTVHLYLATSGANGTDYTGSVVTTVEGPLMVSGAAAPVIYDIDNDNDKDLLVGATDGTVSLCTNLGTDAAPELSAPVVLFRISSPVAPFFVDWDGDNAAELLLAADEHIYVYESVSGNYKAVAVLSVADELINDNNGKSTSGTYSLGNRLRLFSVDLDGKSGKDLLVGNSAGEIRYVRSYGSAIVESFRGSLVEKVDQIDTFLAAGETGAVRAAIEIKDYKEAAKQARALLATMVSGASGYVEIEQLVHLLD